MKNRDQQGSREEGSTSICEVAVARPFLGTLAYSIPDSLSSSVKPGVRVRVPLGRKNEVGVVERLGLRGDRSAAPKLRGVLDVLDEAPILEATLLQLSHWISAYYAVPLGMVLKTALPPGMLGERAAGKGGPKIKTEKVVRLTTPLTTLSERDRMFGRARRQRAAYETLESLGGEAAVSQMIGQLNFSRTVLKGLVSKDLVELADRPVHRDPFADEPPVPESIDLTLAQRDVIAGIHRLDGTGEVALLRGVTGSGKTIVYLELLEKQLAQGRGGIVLVPEISLTPQTVQRFRACFGDAVAVLHSGLSDGERFDAWRGLREGTKRVAIGARSAVFAPVHNLGAIIVDEEHEGSYKQSDTPRYHARSVAVMRSRMENCLCLLGSATPALESWENARSGRYHLFQLEDRVTGKGLPSVDLVDLRAGLDSSKTSDPPIASQLTSSESELEDEMPAELHGVSSRIFSGPLRRGIRDRLELGEQVILFLNRRGYASFAECLACGHIWTCKSCSVTLTYHRRRSRLVCHHCGYEADLPTRCAVCEDLQPRFTGIGTEQVERTVSELFPTARIARMDLDTTGSKWAHFEILEAFRRGEIDVLLGTQMIAKGLDFPNVTLVGVINADVGLHIPDFRASEKTFQLLEQVAGRAGRGEVSGEVIVQTSRPNHTVLTRAVDHDYMGFAESELKHRAELGYPPFRRLANLVISGSDEHIVVSTADNIAAWTGALIRNHKLEGIEVIGPAPCPIDRLRNRWRWHFLLKADNSGTMGSVLRFLAHKHGQLGSGLRLEIDRDPETLL